ncbi:MAG TPA: SAM-dependent methyltransferase [Gammaproteobacteria bacterium]|jgi:predicted TPR repeat methyltransferase|nr:SAM-dependent methyltransferase [Acidiferrobacteraceae bacterium]MDP6398747.1 class I SAM-dependent methyltransferase [Arenicellales bacterium]HCX87479.1 SAM-dependent methyltransferase [Gammaproteobacteria bacterium]MDP6551224.1 class I SAM-dependent methyltransferase [Arenicellales bacterium]MDP6790834.1 class I SAM-dependent methyltransferase [Arenicellales bacterium]|tara:strand:+ start:16298 stop:16966 length:669 start_codon:yes stop_codon:yes gene_type:complete
MHKSEHRAKKAASLEDASSAALLERAYGLDTSGEARDLYRDWASTYDAHLEKGLRYLAPQRIAEILAEVLEDPSALILDIGCGTGLVADYLSGHGFNAIDGLDFSPEMLAVAAEKSLYRTLIEADLEKPLDIADESYDAAICCGTFTHGHVGPQALAEICRVLRPGTPFACTIHAHLWEEAGFAAEIASLEARCIAVLEEVTDEPYFEGAPADARFCMLRRR